MQRSIIFKTRFQALQMKAKVSDKYYLGLVLAAAQARSKAAGLVCQTSWSSSLQLGIPASSRERFTAHTQPDSSLAARCCIRHPWDCLKTATGGVFPQTAGMCGHITMSHGWGYAQVPPGSAHIVPFLSGRIKEREGLWAGIIPWLPASVFHVRTPSLMWMLPPVTGEQVCATHFQLQRGAWWKQAGSEIKIKYFLMQTVTANPQLEQANHYSNNKRWLSNLQISAALAR